MEIRHQSNAFCSQCIPVTMWRKNEKQNPDENNKLFQVQPQIQNKDNWEMVKFLQLKL